MTHRRPWSPLDAYAASFAVSGPVHGRYCGWGHTDDWRNVRGVDQVDELCREHDARYDLDADASMRAHADLALADGLEEWLQRYPSAPAPLREAAASMERAMRVVAVRTLGADARNARAVPPPRRTPPRRRRTDAEDALRIACEADALLEENAC